VTISQQHARTELRRWAATGEVEVKAMEEVTVVTRKACSVVLVFK
jgi:hypothetical protein